ncbi:MAG: universal stress protein [Deltaproteobacteria bacterium]|nr:universal stress protein [Deltaproteobacteria bacterium]
MRKRILVPVDFSDASSLAVTHAVELAGRLGAELILLHVVEPVYYPVAGDLYGLDPEFGNVYDAVERTARQQLAKLTTRVRARHAATRELLVLGTAYRSIVAQAKRLRADLIVMSTHGRSGLSHALLGSVAERVVRLAPCPVLTVPARGVKRARSGHLRLVGEPKRRGKRRAASA